jgi:repressor LexA
MELTQRQQQICQFIAQFSRQHGFAPTIREIQSSLDISSTSVVHYNLRALARAGRLTRKDGFSRTIVLTLNSSKDQAHCYARARSVPIGVTAHAE